MEHKLSNLKKLQSIKLSDEERAYLRGRLSQMVMTPAPSGRLLFARGVQHGLSIALSSFLFVIFVGGSMSAVASKALPGDDLYGFKIAVNEKVRARLLSSPEEKVAFAQTRVSKRVDEIKTLAQTKTLTKEKQAIAQKALDENIQELTVQLNSLSEESPSSALSVTANLEQDLIANQEVIKNTFDTSVDNETATATLKTIEGTLKKVSEQEVKILTKEIENLSDEIDSTPIDATSIENAQGQVRGESTTTVDDQTPVPPPVTPASP
jgi:hypothetical protein